jgi:hypothetical protein
LNFDIKKFVTCPQKERIMKYILDKNVKNAKIAVFTMIGTPVKTFDLTRSGQIEITQSELSPGMYLYSLITDGTEVDTKRMIFNQ